MKFVRAEGVVESEVVLEDDFNVGSAVQVSALTFSFVNFDNLCVFSQPSCVAVPFTCSEKKFKFLDKLPDREMGLCDVAPTVLQVMGLPIPSDMTGKPLVTEA
ncbi:unnamed protein product [Gongylonema pulchrum]|uniref:HotDog ACOT-type domain-containing protein n=1 Tax=Gongylonema pulchrum TaxID=637853 RepID=A0A183DMP9_9BILA|nr:unnamed protein product [Gongylonema pulchrum]